MSNFPVFNLPVLMTWISIVLLSFDLDLQAPETKKKAYEQVVRECQKHGILFCFGGNSGLSRQLRQLRG